MFKICKNHPQVEGEILIETNYFIFKLTGSGSSFSDRTSWGKFNEFVLFVLHLIAILRRFFFSNLL